MTLNPDTLRDQLASMDSRSVVRWAWDTFGTDVAVVSSFQREDVPLLHIVAYEAPDIPVVFRAGRRHTEDVAVFRDQVVELLGLTLVLDEQGLGAVQPPPSDPGSARAFGGYRALISGRRREVGGSGPGLEIVQCREDGLLLIHPMLDWDSHDLALYSKLHRLPLSEPESMAG